MARPGRDGTAFQLEAQKRVGPEFVHPLISEGKLCLDLINSEHFDYLGREGPHDDLEQPEWIQSFSRHWRLSVVSPPDAFALVALRMLRALLRQMFETVASGQFITEDQTRDLNTFLTLTPIMQQANLVDGKLSLQAVPLQTSWNSVLTQSALSWVDLLARTPSQRLKICANPDCHWVFIDQSHNLSRRWCRQQVCGNLMKVRECRARREHKLLEE